MLEDTSSYWEQLASEEIRDCDTVVGGPTRRKSVARAPPGSAPFLEHIFTLPNRRVILDAACGYGRYLVPLAEHLSIVGLDLSWSMLKRWKSNVKKLGLQAELVRADLRYLPFRDRSFDAVTCLNSLYYVKPEYWQEILRDFVRVLADGGELDFNLRMRRAIRSPHYGYGLFVALASVVYEMEKCRAFGRFWGSLGFRSMQGNFTSFTTKKRIRKLLEGLPISLIKTAGEDRRTYVLQKCSI